LRVLSIYHHFEFISIACLVRVEFMSTWNSPSTPSRVSAQKEGITVCRFIALLLAHPTVNVNLAGKDGATVLLIAVSSSDEAVVRLLLDVSHIVLSDGTAEPMAPQ
jgi:hypothetical protein